MILICFAQSYSWFRHIFMRFFYSWYLYHYHCFVIWDYIFELDLGLTFVTSKKPIQEFISRKCESKFQSFCFCFLSKARSQVKRKNERTTSITFTFQTFFSFWIDMLRNNFWRFLLFVANKLAILKLSLDKIVISKMCFLKY